MPRPSPIIVPYTEMKTKSTNASVDIGAIMDFFKQRKLEKEKEQQTQALADLFGSQAKQAMGTEQVPQETIAGSERLGVSPLETGGYNVQTETPQSNLLSNLSTLIGKGGVDAKSAMDLFKTFTPETTKADAIQNDYFSMALGSLGYDPSKLSREQNVEAIKKAQEIKQGFGGEGQETDLQLYSRLATSPNPTDRARAEKMLEIKRESPETKGAIKATSASIDKAADRVSKLGEKADMAEKSMGVLSDARSLLDSGVYTGKFADFKLAFDKILQEGGINIGGQIATNTDTFKSLMGKQVAQVIKDFGSGTGLSDADREYAEKIAGGDITLTEDAIRKLLDMGEKISQFDIRLYNESVDDFNAGKYFVKKKTSSTIPQKETTTTNNLPEGMKAGW